MQLLGITSSIQATLFSRCYMFRKSNQRKRSSYGCPLLYGNPRSCWRKCVILLILSNKYRDISTIFWKITEITCSVIFLLCITLLIFRKWLLSKLQCFGRNTQLEAIRLRSLASNTNQGHTYSWKLQGSPHKTHCACQWHLYHWIRKSLQYHRWNSSGSNGQQ